MVDLANLAAWTVALLTPFLRKAAEKGAEKLGESAEGTLSDVFKASPKTLFDKLKASLKTPTGQLALSDWAKAPDDANLQAAVRMEILKAAEQDPQFASQLQEQVKELPGVVVIEGPQVSQLRVGERADTHGSGDGEPD